MDYKTLKNMARKERAEYLSTLSDEDADELFENLIEELSDDEDVYSHIYEGRCCYFVIAGGIYEISDDASCSPKGGFFPEIVAGLSREASNEIEEILENVGHKDCLEEMVDIILDDFEEDIEDDEALEWFEDEEETEMAELYKAIAKDLKENYRTIWSVYEFCKRWKRLDLEEGVLYYEWEGDYIDFYDNILECGEPEGTYESLSTIEWIEQLCDLEDSIVTAEEY